MPKIYCGNSDNLPQGYTRNGTRFECLKKGYGAALVYSTADQRKRAIESIIAKVPKLKKEELQTIAIKMGAKIFNTNGSVMKKADLIQSIIDKLESFL